MAPRMLIYVGGSCHIIWFSQIFNILKYLILVSLRQTFFIVILDFGVISAPTIKKAAEDGSPETLIFFEYIS